jgi:hypothetical protein
MEYCVKVVTQLAKNFLPSIESERPNAEALSQDWCSYGQEMLAPGTTPRWTTSSCPRYETDYS